MMMIHDIVKRKKDDGTVEYFAVRSDVLPFVAYGDPCETMVFHSSKKGDISNWIDIDGERCTEQNMKETHERLCKKWGEIVPKYHEEQLT